MKMMMITRQTEICRRYEGGCGYLSPDGENNIIVLGDGRWGYRPVDCCKAGRCACGFFPVRKGNPRDIPKYKDIPTEDEVVQED